MAQSATVDVPSYVINSSHALPALYGIVAVIALVQVIRVQLRVPEYGWTIQKLLYLLIFIIDGVRCLVFVFRRDVQRLQPAIGRHIVLDLPSLAFCTTYGLLVLFWAEIYYQARTVPTDRLRPTFYKVNAIVYAIQSIIWLVLWWKPAHVLVVLSNMLCAGISLFVALGFLLYGGRFILMLQRFPVESKGRREKIQEIGSVTSICFLCFLARSIMTCLNAFGPDADLLVLNHPVFLMVVEILPSAMALFIYRKLPPKRGITQHHNLH